MHISSRDLSIVLKPRKRRALKEVSSTITSLWSVALVATESSSRCCFDLDLASRFLPASANELMLFALRFIPVGAGAGGSTSALLRDAADRALCIPLRECPDAMRFMLPRLVIRFMDESTSSLTRDAVD